MNEMQMERHKKKPGTNVPGFLILIKIVYKTTSLLLTMIPSLSKRRR
jgi:hypothetical protein